MIMMVVGVVVVVGNGGSASGGGYVSSSETHGGLSPKLGNIHGVALSMRKHCKNLFPSEPRGIRRHN